MYKQEDAEEGEDKEEEKKRREDQFSLWQNKQYHRLCTYNLLFF